MDYLSIPLEKIGQLIQQSAKASRETDIFCGTVLPHYGVFVSYYAQEDHLWRRAYELYQWMQVEIPVRSILSPRLSQPCDKDLLRAHAFIDLFVGTPRSTYTPSPTTSPTTSKMAPIPVNGTGTLSTRSEDTPSANLHG